MACVCTCMCVTAVEERNEDVLCGRVSNPNSSTIICVVGFGLFTVLKNKWRQFTHGIRAQNFIGFRK